GMGMGLGLNFYDGAHHDYGSLVEPISISGTSVYIHITLRTGLSFRISPAWTADLGVIFGGAGELSNSGDLNERTRPPMEAIFLGVTYRRPYGR
ncbi:hypothetical protein LJC14_07565, partial [Treponema sp. OttesenSCG-928-L16]|nr:hypothetical protein [Treponema sp. OttesenSCG-928-L16]